MATIYMSKKTNTVVCRNEMFQNGCLMWVNYFEGARDWYECFWQKPDEKGAITLGDSTEGERFIRLTGERKSKPSKTELLKTLKKKGICPIEFTVPNPFGV